MKNLLPSTLLAALLLASGMAWAGNGCGCPDRCESCEKDCKCHENCECKKGDDGRCDGSSCACNKNEKKK